MAAKMKYWNIAGILCVSLFLILLGSCNQSTTNLARPASEVALDNVLGQYNLRGKVTLIQFGMVGCANSNEGFGQMIALQKSNSQPNVNFLRVEQGTDDAAIAAYYKEKTPPFPVHYDKQAALAQALGATAYPDYILVDKFGHVRYIGKYPEAQMNEWVALLSGEKADPGKDTPMLGAVNLDVAKLLQQTNLPDLSSATTQPLTQYKDQFGLLIVFVDTNCPFSAEALRDLPKVAPQLAKMKIPTVVINLDDPLDAVQKHYANQPLGVPVLYDVTTTTKTNWSIDSVPTLVYITPDQKIGYNGTAVWKNLASALETNLKLNPGSINFTPQGTGFG